jgi:uncharacterized small protein (DUF1192 family)
LPGSNSQQENLATAVTEVSERMAVLVREEIELAKAEMMQKVSSIARGAAAIAAGAVFGVFAVIFILETIAWGINDAVNSLWIGFAIVMVVLLIMTVAAFLLARRAFRVGPVAPQMAIDEAKKIRETVSAGPGPQS